MTQSKNNICPLGQLSLSEIRDDSGRYYWPGEHKRKTTFSAKRLRKLTVSIIGGEEINKIEVDGVLWTYVEQLSVSWEFAPDDPRYTKPDTERPVNPRHIHAWFQLGKHEVHVDYVRFTSYGPGMVIQEFLVFVDGALRGRGGHLGCLGSTNQRNWPLAIRLKDQLLLLDKYFDGGSDDCTAFTGLSLWSLEQASRRLVNSAK